MTAEPWAVREAGEPGHEQDSPRGAADAMRLIVAAAKTAPAQPERTRALRYLVSWPVGQRMRLELTAGDPPRVAAVTEFIQPFPRPLTDAERGGTGQRGVKPARRRARRGVDEDDLQGTRADSDGELRLRRRPAGYADEDTQLEQEFLDADDAAGAPASCGACFPCLDGRPADCEHPESQETVAGKRADPLRGWLDTARAGDDISAPAVVIEPGAGSTGAMV